jgi:type VI secretion system protein ImpF
MARLRHEQPLVTSVLDRLLDDNPGGPPEVQPERHQVLRDLKDAVRRDLEDLLNTRSCCRPPPPDLPELQDSLLTYGLPDFTGVNVGSSKSREELRALLEAIIRRHEPRFRSVKVELPEGGEPLDRTMRFRIDALLNVQPRPEPVVFDSLLKSATGTFEVQGSEE